MRRFTTLCTVLALAATSAVKLDAADGLFSDVPINSVFLKPGSTPAPAVPPQQTPPGPPANSQPAEGSLASALRGAGFDPVQVSDDVLQTKVKADKWSFPLIITRDQEKQETVLVLLLSNVKDEKQLSADKLLEILDANREHSPAHFAYSSKRKRIELYRTLSATAPTAEQLKAEIERLADVAKSTEGLWNLASAAAPQAPTASAAPTSSLTGKWSAARSAKEAFALQLTSDGRFALVHLRNGKRTKSTGTYSLSGDQLVLSGSDGMKLTGKVSEQSSQQFVFTPQGGKAAAISFKRAS